MLSVSVLMLMPAFLLILMVTLSELVDDDFHNAVDKFAMRWLVGMRMMAFLAL